MSVEPVKYTLENVIAVKQGDVIPERSVIFCQSGNRTWSSTFDRAMEAGPAVKYYAPAPILDLPPEPKEVPFGEAMERIKDGEEFLWELNDRREIVGQDRRVLCFMRSPSNYPINNFGELGDGRFYEIPYPPKPEPKTTGLKWWEAIEAIRGTGKIAQPVGSVNSALKAKWVGDELMDGRCKPFRIMARDLAADWKIID